MIVKLEEPVGEENINEPGGMEKLVWAAMQISTLHHLSSCKIQTILGGTGFDACKEASHV